MNFSHLMSIFSPISNRAKKKCILADIKIMSMKNTGATYNYLSLKVFLSSSLIEAYSSDCPVNTGKLPYRQKLIFEQN